MKSVPERCEKSSFSVRDSTFGGSGVCGFGGRGFCDAENGKHEYIEFILGPFWARWRARGWFKINSM